MIAALWIGRACNRPHVHCDEDRSPLPALAPHPARAQRARRAPQRHRPRTGCARVRPSLPVPRSARPPVRCVPFSPLVALISATTRYCMAGLGRLCLLSLCWFDGDSYRGRENPATSRGGGCGCGGQGCAGLACDAEGGRYPGRVGQASESEGHI